MRVHAPKLICSTGVSNFHTFKLLFRMYSKLCLPAAILSWWVFDVILSSIQPSQVQSVSFKHMSQFKVWFVVIYNLIIIII